MSPSRTVETRYGAPTTRWSSSLSTDSGLEQMDGADDEGGGGSVRVKQHRDDSEQKHAAGISFCEVILKVTKQLKVQTLKPRQEPQGSTNQPHRCF